MNVLKKGDLVRHPSCDFQLRVVRVCGADVECMEAYGHNEQIYRFRAHELTRVPRPMAPS
jgi:hypothetical protein